MNTLPQYKPLLQGKNNADKISQRAREIHSWIQSVDNSRSDSNPETGLIDHIQMGMGFEVQASIKNLGPNRFYTNGQAVEFNRMLTNPDGTQVATQAQVFESLVCGFEVTRWPDGTTQGFEFSGCPSDAGSIKKEMSGEAANVSWSKVYIRTLHLAPPPR